jgi:hypothetical protein
MGVFREVEGVLGRIRMLGWVTLLMTLILLAQVNLITTTAWADLDLQTQLTIFGITLGIVVALGFSRRGPEGFLKSKRRR